jgi:hypothetical protein
MQLSMCAHARIAMTGGPPARPAVMLLCRVYVRRGRTCVSGEALLSLRRTGGNSGGSGERHHEREWRVSFPERVPSSSVFGERD